MRRVDDMAESGAVGAIYNAATAMALAAREFNEFVDIPYQFELTDPGRPCSELGPAIPPRHWIACGVAPYADGNNMIVLALVCDPAPSLAAEAGAEDYQEARGQVKGQGPQRVGGGPQGGGPQGVQPGVSPTMRDDVSRKHEGKPRLLIVEPARRCCTILREDVLALRGFKRYGIGDYFLAYLASEASSSSQ